MTQMRHDDRSPGVLLVRGRQERPEPGQDPPSFEDFFAHQRDRLVRALWLLVRNQQEAEEIAQDAFVRLWERWERVASHPDPEGYLYRTALNLARSRRRRLVVALRRTV